MEGVREHGSRYVGDVPDESQTKDPETFPQHVTPASVQATDLALNPSKYLVMGDSATPMAHPTEEVEDLPPMSAVSGDTEWDKWRSIIQTPESNDADGRPLRLTPSGRQMSEHDMIRHLSRRQSRQTGDPLSRTSTGTDDDEAGEVNRLVSRMFGRTRQAHSEEEKTRHRGVVFKHLTVKGTGLGAALQPTVGDIALGIPRLVMRLFSSRARRAAGKPPLKTIIDDFSGVIKPGEMCLVLGRPGSGCSTFLKVLGNQRSGFTAIEGDVAYGGVDAKHILKKYRSEVIYNPEDDLHYATLSVKNTLKFALTLKTPGAESRNENESAKSYVETFLRSVVKLFWIEHTLETKVGDEYVRGVSGGEKKRVSIAEALITRASIQAWDNSTRGLDSSTALEYVSSLRALTNAAKISTAVALYQAGESLYELFDKVLLIDDGRCAYFGPAETAVKYFKDLGFTAPERWTSADFLTSVTDLHERQIQPGWEDRVPRNGAEFGDTYKKSELYQRNLEEIEEFEREAKVQVEERQQVRAKVTTRNYTVPFHKQVWACTERQFLIMIGDRQALFGKWGGIVFQSLIVGSLFYNLPVTSAGVFQKGGVIFFTLLFNALLALAELTAAFTSRPILLKHKSFQFYRPSAFAIAQTVVDAPLVFIQVTLFNLIVYFMSNLARTASQFFISLLFLFVLTMTMYAFFRSIGALAGSLDVATRITGVALQALVVYTGYLIPPKSMRPWFSWLRRIDPIAYGFEALMANEFYNERIQCVPPDLVPFGPGAVKGHQSCTLQGSIPGQTFVHGADYIHSGFEYTRAHLWRNFGIIIGFFIFFVCLTALGMELQKPNKGGGAVTTYLRGHTPQSVARALENQGELNDLEKSRREDSITPREPEKEIGQSSSNDSGEENGSSAEGLAKNETIFTWQNVNYTIPFKGGERQLLRDVQGFVRPGKLTALMGASGAGKTTLLNTLAQRITFGVVTGDFLVDGRPLPKSFQRASGFAEQQDVHEPTATVREALRFSAKLRQPREVPLQEKYDYCETVIKLLEMESIAGATIGRPGSGLNLEQRKRLTIGVELASKPELLMFLDEPTSGLDSGAAFNIIRFLRKLADAGQAILATIHQPSAVLFEEFDELLLLQRGGRTVFHGELGPDSKHMIEYFESNGAKKCPPEENPAEYMLEVIGAGNPAYGGEDWADVWDRSSEKEARTRDIEAMTQERRKVAAHKELRDDREYAMPLRTQVYTVVYRNFVSYWRSPEYLIGKFALHILSGLFNTFSFYNLGHSRIDMQNRLFSIFMTFTIAPPLIQQLQPRFLDSRRLFTSRERNSKIYSWFAFVCAAVLPELPWSFLAGTIYWCCWYWGLSFPRSTLPSASAWLFIGLFEMWYVSFGQAIASFAPNDVLASLLVPVFFIFVVSFSGVVVPYAALPYFWRSWMYYVTPFHYLVAGLLALATHDVPVVCKMDELAKFSSPEGISCEAYAGAFAKKTGGYVTTLDSGLCGLCQYSSGDGYARAFNVFYSDVWRNYGIFWAYIVFNFAFIFFCSWLFLEGGRKIKRSMEQKKHSKIQMKGESGTEPGPKAENA